MMRPILFVDFDRTLFDTPKFMQEAWAAIGLKYGIDGLSALKTAPSFYVPVGEQSHYDFKRHIQTVLGADPTPVVAYARQKLSGTDFLYPDTHAFLDTLPDECEFRILTFGAKWFQEFKMSLAPELASVPIDIILEPKRDFIRRQYPNRTGWLIDDKLTQQLPHGFVEVNIDRSSELPLEQKNAMIVVNSLTQIQEII